MAPYVRHSALSVRHCPAMTISTRPLLAAHCVHYCSCCPTQSPALESVRACTAAYPHGGAFSILRSRASNLGIVASSRNQANILLTWGRSRSFRVRITPFRGIRLSTPPSLRSLPGQRHLELGRTSSGRTAHPTASHSLPDHRRHLPQWRPRETPCGIAK